MSLSQGCTAEYRTVLVWSTTDTRADPAAHTVRIAALQNALPPTNYEHPPYPPAYVDLSRLSVCQSWLSIGLRKKAPGQMCPETDCFHQVSTPTKLITTARLVDRRPLCELCSCHGQDPSPKCSVREKHSQPVAQCYLTGAPSLAPLSLLFLSWAIQHTSPNQTAILSNLCTLS